MTDRHQLVQIRTYPDGLTYRHVFAGRGSAADVQRERERRLRDCRIPHRSGQGWCEYREQRHVEPCTVRLEWTDLDEGDHR